LKGNIDVGILHLPWTQNRFFAFDEKNRQYPILRREGEIRESSEIKCLPPHSNQKPVSKQAVLILISDIAKAPP